MIIIITIAFFLCVVVAFAFDRPKDGHVQPGFQIGLGERGGVVVCLAKKKKCPEELLITGWATIFFFELCVCVCVCLREGERLFHQKKKEKKSLVLEILPRPRPSHMRCVCVCV